MTNLRVCVFCASRAGSSPAFTAAAESLARLLHAHNFRLLYGGGNRGLMGTVAKTMSRLGGEVHGVIPRALIRREVKSERYGSDKGGEPGNAETTNGAHNRVHGNGVPDEGENGGGDDDDDGAVKSLKAAPSGVVNGGDDVEQIRMMEESIGSIHVVDSMHERKAYMAEHGDAFVALPGGFGTLDELIEIITWSQIGIHAKPIVLYNVDGFFDNFLRFVDDFFSFGFVDEETRGIVAEAKTAEEVVQRIKEYVPPGGRMELDWQKKQEVKS